MATTRTSKIKKKKNPNIYSTRARYCLLIRKREPRSHTRQLIAANQPLVEINVIEDFENGREGNLKSVVVRGLLKSRGTPGSAVHPCEVQREPALERGREFEHAEG